MRDDTDKREICGGSPVLPGVGGCGRFVGPVPEKEDLQWRSPHLPKS